MARLTVGMRAPNFAATTHDGRPISLRDYDGYPVWMIFYRYPGCPLCNLHISALTHRYEKYFSSSLRIIAVFESPRDKFPKKLAGKPFPPFPLIADPERRLYELYGTETSLGGVFNPGAVGGLFKALIGGNRQGRITGNLAQIPAHFLIAEDGVIEDIYYGTNIADHIPFEDVDRFLRERNIGSWETAAIL
jgi:peroxiredoxin Q/BCP